MPDYQKMYIASIDKMERSLELLEQAKALLIEGMRDAERIYIDTAEDEE